MSSPLKRDRRGRADVRLWRHGGDVGGHGDDGAGRVRARSGRRDVDDDRHLRGEEALDDPAHRRREPSRGVEHEHHRRVVALLGAVDRVVDELLRDGVDVVREMHRENARRAVLRENGRGRRKRSDDERDGENSPQTSAWHRCKDSICAGSPPLPANCVRVTLEAPCAVSCSSSQPFLPRSARFHPCMRRPALASPRSSSSASASARSRRAEPCRGSRSPGCTGAAPGRCSSEPTRRTGSWSPWRAAAPEPEDGPDPSSRERGARGWRFGNPWWVGESDRIQARAIGDVTRIKAHLVWSPETLIPLRAPAATVTPPIVPRSSWGADETIRRAPAELRDRCPLRDRPPHRGPQRLLAGGSGRDREGNPALPRAGERLERHRLQLSRRPLRDGLRGAVRRRRPQRRRRACAGVQHRLRRCRAPRNVRRRRSVGSRAGRHRTAHRLASRRRACRSDRISHVHLGRQRSVPDRRSGALERRLRSPRHGIHRVSGRCPVRASRRDRRIGARRGWPEDLRAEGSGERIVDPRQRAALAATELDGRLQGARAEPRPLVAVARGRPSTGRGSRPERRPVRTRGRSRPERHARLRERCEQAAARHRSRSGLSPPSPRRSVRTATGRPIRRR